MNLRKVGSAIEVLKISSCFSSFLMTLNALYPCPCCWVGVPSYVRDPPSHAPLCTKERIQGKRKERNDEGQQVAAEKKRRKNRKEKKEAGERE
jgi:hypothetical protein